MPFVLALHPPQPDLLRILLLPQSQRGGPFRVCQASDLWASRFVAQVHAERLNVLTNSLGKIVLHCMEEFRYSSLARHFDELTCLSRSQ